MLDSAHTKLPARPVMTMAQRRARELETFGYVLTAAERASARNADAIADVLADRWIAAGPELLFASDFIGAARESLAHCPR